MKASEDCQPFQPEKSVSKLRENPWGQGWLLRKIEACDLS